VASLPVCLSACLSACLFQSFYLPLYTSSLQGHHHHQQLPAAASPSLAHSHCPAVRLSAGAAVRAPLQLPSPPLALAACGLFVAVLCDDGVHVFDRSSAAEVQHIDYQHDDAHAALVGSLPVASDPAGRAVIFAASGGVLCLQPIALQQQVRELLKRKRFDQALALLAAAEPPAASLLSDGQQDEQLLQQAGQQQATWQQVALAQAGLLLLLECEFEAGLAIMAQLPGSVWQPAQLFPLFPGHTARCEGGSKHCRSVPQHHAVMHDREIHARGMHAYAHTHYALVHFRY
jgi:hypothetical protein